jgi:glutaredoxin 3
MSSPVEAPRANVVLYGTPYCGFCARAARLFHEKGVEVTEIDVSRNRERRSWLLKVTGMRTVPQIFINGRSVKGFEDVALLDRTGELDRLLSEPPSAATPETASIDREFCGPTSFEARKIH